MLNDFGKIITLVELFITTDLETVNQKLVSMATYGLSLPVKICLIYIIC